MTILVFYYHKTFIYVPHTIELCHLNSKNIGLNLQIAGGRRCYHSFSKILDNTCCFPFDRSILTHYAPNLYFSYIYNSDFQATETKFLFIFLLKGFYCDSVITSCRKQPLEIILRHLIYSKREFESNLVKILFF